MKEIYNTFDEEGHVIELTERCRTKEVLKTILIIILSVFCISLLFNNRDLKINNYKLKQNNNSLKQELKEQQKEYKNIIKNA